MENRKLKITRKHAIDLLHAVVPVAYCDFVLLDKNWRTQVEHARTRFNKAGLSVPIARIFSEQENGIERFLYELESGG